MIHTSIQINPRIDLAFKKLFGSEENKDILIDFINSVVSAADQVQDIQLLNPYNLESFPKDKLSILDIKAKDTHGKYFNIEIQIIDQQDYDKRALYYWAQLYASQLKKGFAYRELRKTIGIHVLNFLSIPNKKDYHSIFTIRDMDTNEPKFEDFELHTIELIKFDENTPNDLQSIASKMRKKLDLWVAFLTKYNIIHTTPLNQAFQEKALIKALSVLSHMSLTDIERERYQAGEKWYLDEEAALHKAHREGLAEGHKTGLAEGHKTGLEEGLAEGHKTGLEEGLERGHKTGLEEGLERGHKTGLEEGLERGHKTGLEEGLEEGANRKAEEIALRLIQSGHEDSTILETTGLTVQALKQLRER